MAAFGMSQVDALNALRAASVLLNTGGTTDSGLDAVTQILPSLGTEPNPVTLESRIPPDVASAGGRHPFEDEATRVWESGNERFRLV
jgi:hypothetical protein